MRALCDKMGTVCAGGAWCSHLISSHLISSHLISSHHAESLVQRHLKLETRHAWCGLGLGLGLWLEQELRIEMGLGLGLGLGRDMPCGGMG